MYVCMYVYHTCTTKSDVQERFFDHAFGLNLNANCFYGNIKLCKFSFA